MDKGALDSIVDLAVEARGGTLIPTVHDGVPFLVVSDNERIERLDFEKHQLRPNRPRGTMEFRDVESFAIYTKAHAEDGTVILLDSHRLTAVFNHHLPMEDLDEPVAGWSDWTATFTPKFTRGWTAWTGFDRKGMNQQSFAEFIEERIAEIASPDGGPLLEAIRKLQIKVDVTYESVIRPDNDTINLTFKENMEQGGADKVRLPSELTLVVTPFEGAQSEQLTAKLRVTKPDNHGAVQFSVALSERVQEILDKADADMAARVTAITAIGVLRGKIVEKNS